MSRLNKKNLLSVLQHGFRQGHLPGFHLLECLNYFASALEESKCVNVCYIDIIWAFDSVSIPKLKHKLSSLISMMHIFLGCLIF